jgi:N-sulfoglucosamine sulfohydrolase
MWQSMRKAGKDAMLGGRKVSKYLDRDPEELYDIENDPHEVKNLASSPEHKATLEELRAQTLKFRKTTEDPWLVNDRYK